MAGFGQISKERYTSYLANCRKYVKHIELMAKTTDTTTPPACPKGQGSDTA